MKRLRRGWWKRAGRFWDLLVACWEEHVGSAWLDFCGGFAYRGKRRPWERAPVVLWGESLESRVVPATDSGYVIYNITETGWSAAHGLVEGGDGNLWVANVNDYVGKLAGMSTFTSYNISGGGVTRSPADLTAGSDGKMWMIEALTGSTSSAGIAKMNTDGTGFTEYTLTNHSNPKQMTSGPDGNLWITEQGDQSNSVLPAITKVTTGGTITRYTFGSYGVAPLGIATGPDGNLWFTESGTNKVGKITTGGTMTEYTLPSGMTGPTGIVGGATRDGGVWFSASGKIGRIDPSTGAVAKYDLGTDTVASDQMILGPNNNIWFVDATAIANVDRDGIITRYVGHGGAAVDILTSGGAVYMVNALKIGYPQWAAGGAPLLVDPVQGSLVPLGPTTVAPLTGATRVVYPLDFRLDAGCGCGGVDNDLTRLLQFGLLYDSSTASTSTSPGWPLPLFQTTLGINSVTGGATLSNVSVSLTWNGSPLTGTTYGVSGRGVGDILLFARQASNSLMSLSTGAYSWRITMTANFSDASVITRTVAGQVPLRNNGSSGPGIGWQVVGVDRLISDTYGVTWFYGGGGSRYFRATSAATYLNPTNDFGTLVKNGDNTYTYTATNQLKYNFDTSGYLTTVVDPHNLAATYTYSSGLISSIVLPDGGRATFTYSMGALSTVALPGGRVVTLTRNGSGELTGLAGPDGGLRTFTYNTNHWLTNDRWGPANTTLAYDSTHGYVTSQLLDTGVTMTWSPTASAGWNTSPADLSSSAVGAMSNALNWKTTYTLDRKSRMVTITAPDGGVQTWKLDDWTALPLVYTDPLGHKTTTTYDALGNPTRIDYADATNEQFTYNASNLVTVYQDSLGNKTTYAYNSSGDLTTITNALNKITTLTWASGLLQTYLDALNHTTTYLYETGKRRVQTIVDGLGQRVTYAYDSAGNLQTVTDPLSHVTTYAYDGMRRVTQVTYPDPDGGGALTSPIATLAYDALGHVTSLIDPLGNRTTLAYGPFGVKQITYPDPDGAGPLTSPIATITYDTAGNLQTVIDPLGNRTTYSFDRVNDRDVVTYADPDGAGSLTSPVTTTTYDLAGNATAFIDPLGNRTTFTYDVLNRLKTIKDALNNVTTLTYDDNGNVRTWVDPLGNTTTFGYDALNQRITTKDALNGVTTVTYDDVGNVTALTDPLGNRTTLTYDAVYQLTGIKDALNNLTTLNYDAAGNVQSVIDPLGNRTTFTHDNLDRTTQVTFADPDGAGPLASPISTTVYDAASNVTAAIDPLGNRTTFTYDALNRLVAMKDALNNLVTVNYDAAGNIQSVIDQLGNRTTFAYDALNRNTQVTFADPDGAGPLTSPISTTVYDAASNVTATIDPLGNRTTFSYDAVNRVIAVKDALNNLVTVNYDAAGNIQSVIDQLGNRTTFTYDALNRNTQVTFADPDGAGSLTSPISTTVYDAASNVTAVVDPLGNRTTFTYDAVNRVIAVKDALNNLVTVNYDAAGNVQSVIDQLGNRTTFTYDNLNRNTQITFADPDGAGSLTAPISTTVYDAASNVTAVVDPLGNRTTFTYDALNRVIAVKDALNNLSTVVYDAAGNVQSVIDQLGNRTTFTYDNLNRNTQITFADPDGAGVGVPSPLATTVYDAASNVVATVDPLGNRTTFTYDALNRVIAVKDALNNLATVVYDAAGNVQSVIDQLGNRTTFAYDNLNRNTQVTFADPDGAGPLTSPISTTVYDAASNVTATIDPLGNRTTFTYDALNRVIAVKDALNNLATVNYDAAGNVQSVIDQLGNRTTFTYDNLNRNTQVTFADPDGAGSLTSPISTTVYDAASNATATIDPLGNRTTFTYDALNRVIAVTDALNTLSTVTYDAAGNVQALIDPLGNRTTFTYDNLNRNTQVTFADPDGAGGAPSPIATTVYDAASNVTATIDPLGNRTTFTYDALNRVIAVKDALNNLATTVYDAAGNVQAVIDQLGNRTTFTYDNLNRNTQVTFADPDGAGSLTSPITTTVYDAASNVTATIDPLGNRTTFTYDALNRVIAVKDALNNLSTTVYDAAGNVQATIDPLNHRTTFSYDALNRQTQVTYADPDGGGSLTSPISTTVYDAASNVLAFVNPLGNRTTFTYDALNRVIAVKDPLNNLTTTVYDAAGNVTTEIDALGNRTTFAYDNLNRNTQVTFADPDGAGSLTSPITTNVYDDASNVLAAIDPLGNRTTYSYDALNRVIAVKDPLNFLTTTVYDAAGNVQAQIDQLGNRTTFTYDNLNRLITVKDALNEVTTTVYDAAGNVTATVNALGNRTTFSYDALNRQVTVKDALNNVTTTVYDADGNVVNVVDPLGNKTTFVYDALDRLTQQTDPLNKSTTFAYDAASRMTSTTDRLGRRKDFTYDNADRLTQEVWLTSGNPVNTLAYSFDANSNLLTAGDANGTYTFTYDNLSRVSTQKDMMNVTLTFTYDAASNRTKVEDSFGGVMTSVYDANYQLTSRQFGGTGQTPLRIDYTYTGRGQQATITRYSDLAGTTKVGDTGYTYDVVGQLTHMQSKDGAGNNLENYTYTYDAIGEMLTETRNTTNITTYQYDAIGQLTNDGAAYSFDANGNRNMTGYVTGTGNRTTSDGTWTYTFDDEGNITKKTKGAGAETWTFGYDNNNDLIWVEKRATDGGTLQMRSDYKYDVFGSRVEKAVDPDGAGAATTQTTRFTQISWANPTPGQASKLWEVYADLNGSNQLQTRYLRGDGINDISARISSGGAVAWYLPDGKGSIRDITNASGSVVDHLDYDGFGNTSTTPTGGDRYLFTAQEYDSESGLYYTGGQYYNPLIGKLLTQNADGLFADVNPYRYAGNNPGAEYATLPIRFGAGGGAGGGSGYESVVLPAPVGSGGGADGGSGYDSVLFASSAGSGCSCGGGGMQVDYGEPTSGGSWTTLPAIADGSGSSGWTLMPDTGGSSGNWQTMPLIDGAGQASWQLVSQPLMAPATGGASWDELPSLVPMSMAPAALTPCAPPAGTHKTLILPVDPVTGQPLGGKAVWKTMEYRPDRDGGAQYVLFGNGGQQQAQAPPSITKISIKPSEWWALSEAEREQIRIWWNGLSQAERARVNARLENLQKERRLLNPGSANPMYETDLMVRHRILRQEAGLDPAGGGAKPKPKGPAQPPKPITWLDVLGLIAEDVADVYIDFAYFTNGFLQGLAHGGWDLLKSIPGALAEAIQDPTGMKRAFKVYKAIEQLVEVLNKEGLADVIEMILPGFTEFFEPPPSILESKDSRRAWQERRGEFAGRYAALFLGPGAVVKLVKYLRAVKAALKAGQAIESVPRPVELPPLTSEDPLAGLTPAQRQQLGRFLREQNLRKKFLKLWEEIKEAKKAAEASPKLRKRMMEKGCPPSNLKNPQAHHDLPQKFRKLFEKAGLDIDDPAHGRWVEGGRHQSWSLEFNRAWENFFKKYERMGREPTAQEILDFKKALSTDPRFQ